MRKLLSWRLLQAVTVSLLIATALVFGEIPYPDPCAPCDRGEIAWWLCILSGCW